MHHGTGLTQSVKRESKVRSATPCPAGCLSVHACECDGKIPVLKSIILLIKKSAKTNGGDPLVPYVKCLLVIKT